MSSQERAIVASVQEMLAAIARRWKLVLGVWAGVVLTVLIGVFVLPPQYRAAGKILVTTDRADISTDPDRGTELVRTNQVSDGEMRSQLQILRSRTLVDGVLSDMGAPAEPEAGRSWLVRTLAAPFGMLRDAYRRMHSLEHGDADDPLYWQAREALRRLETSNEQPSNVIEVAFVGSDPAWARDFVNALMRDYVAHHARLQRIDQAQAFFDDQSQVLREKLTASEAALQAARERIGTLAGRQDEVHERLNEFRADLARAQVDRQEQAQRVAFLERAAQQRGRIATPELLELEATRAQLVGKYRPDSQRMRSLDRQIARLRAAIAGYDRITSVEEGDDTGQGTDLVAARAALAALRGREEALTQSVEEYRGQAEFLDRQSFELARLERQVTLDEEAYLSYVRSAEQSRLANALDQSKLLQLRIIEPATLPIAAAAPKKAQAMLIALVGGLVLGLGLAVLRDHFDGTVHGSADVRRYTGLDTLAVLPERT